MPMVCAVFHTFSDLSDHYWYVFLLFQASDPGMAQRYVNVNYTLKDDVVDLNMETLFYRIESKPSPPPNMAAKVSMKSVKSVSIVFVFFFH